MSTAIFAFTARGVETALRIGKLLDRDGGAEVFAPEKFAGQGISSYRGDLCSFVGTAFDRDALIFVGACGIAVRAIAPHVAGKAVDPAVLCIDEAGRFAISLLSGHIGGANRLARRLARELGAMPVITTATDLNGRFSVDEWASARGFALSDLAQAKRVSAEILVRDIPIWADGKEAPERLPDGLVWGSVGDLGICVSCRDIHPFDATLLVSPKALRVGIGCRKGIPEAAVSAAVQTVFRNHGLRFEAVAGAASIDAKSEEKGLLEFCAQRGWPLHLYSAEALRAVTGSVSQSEFVARTMGVDNVCERAALASGGRLIVPKSVQDGVTVAVAEMEWGMEFGEASRGGHRSGKC